MVLLIEKTANKAKTIPQALYSYLLSSALMKINTETTKGTVKKRPDIKSPPMRTVYKIYKTTPIEIVEGISFERKPINEPRTIIAIVTGSLAMESARYVIPCDTISLEGIPVFSFA